MRTTTCSSRTSAWSSASTSGCRSTPAASASSRATTSRPRPSSACRSSASASSTRGGYFRQGIDKSGRQTEDYQPVDPEAVGLVREDVSVTVELAGETIEAAVWRKDVASAVGVVPLYLLEVDWLTDALYGGDREHRIRQELLLGVGGVRALAALGIEPNVFHLNEGHSAFLQLERLRALVADGADTDDALEHDPALVRLHDAHAGAGGQRGLRRGARRPLRRRSRRGGRARPRAPARARPLRRRARLRPDALRAAALRLRERRLRSARRGRARDVGAALAGRRRRPIGHVTNGVHLGTWLDPALAELLRFAGVQPRGAARRGELGCGPRRTARGGLARPRRREGAARRARRHRPRPAHDRLRAPLRHLQARRARLLRRRAAAGAAGPDRRRRQGASRPTRPART